MKTREAIKHSAKSLFSSLGVRNVTLREVAKSLGKSYGNITYHFKTKEMLLEELYQDFNKALSGLQLHPEAFEDLLSYFLALPSSNYELMEQYLFFHLDYIEIKRAYPAFMQKAERLNSERKKGWMFLMMELQSSGYLQPQLQVSDLEYIMELSASMRLFFFQSRQEEEYGKRAFVEKVNRLLLPYLSKKGVEIWKKHNMLTNDI